MSLKRAINNFKANYSQAKSLNAREKKQTTYHCIDKNYGYDYVNANGEKGPMAEFNDHNKALIYKYYEADKEMNEYNKKIHDLVKDEQNGYVVKMTEDYAEKYKEQNNADFVKNISEFKKSEDMLKVGLENNVFVIKDKDGNVIDVPKAPECKNDTEYMVFCKERQMARASQNVRGNSFQNKLSRMNPLEQNKKVHEGLRRDLDAIENGVNPEIAKFNEKFGTDISVRPHNHDEYIESRREQQQAIEQHFSKEDEAMAFMRIANSIMKADNAKDKTLNEIKNDPKYSSKSDKDYVPNAMIEDKGKDKDKDSKEFYPEMEKAKAQPAPANTNMPAPAGEKQDGQTFSKEAAWNALYNKVCEFIKEYREDPVKALNKLMTKYEDAFKNIKNDKDNPHHDDLQKMLEVPESPVSEYVGEQLNKEREDGYYLERDKYYQSKDRHLDTYRNAFMNEENKDIEFINENNVKYNLKPRDVAQMSENEFELFVRCIDDDYINMIDKTGEQIDKAEDGFRWNDDFETEKNLYNLKQYKQMLENSENAADRNQIQNKLTNAYNEVTQNDNGKSRSDTAKDKFKTNVEKYNEIHEHNKEQYFKTFEEYKNSGKPLYIGKHDKDSNEFIPVHMKKDFSDFTDVEKEAFTDLMKNKRLFIYDENGENPFKDKIKNYGKPTNETMCKVYDELAVNAKSKEEQVYAKSMVEMYAKNRKPFDRDVVMADIIGLSKDDLTIYTQKNKGEERTQAFKNYISDKITVNNEKTIPDEHNIGEENTFVQEEENVIIPTSFADGIPMEYC